MKSTTDPRIWMRDIKIRKYTLSKMGVVPFLRDAWIEKVDDSGINFRVSLPTGPGGAHYDFKFRAEHIQQLEDAITEFNRKRLWRMEKKLEHREKTS